MINVKASPDLASYIRRVLGRYGTAVIDKHGNVLVYWHRAVAR